MLCLACGATRTAEVGEPCPECNIECTPVDGIYGVNNVTQLLTGIEEFRGGLIDLDTLLTRFDLFEQKWEAFQRRWKLDNDTAPALFDLPPEKKPFYEPSLNQIEEAFVCLGDAFELLDHLEEPDAELLDEIEEHLRSFFHGICSASAVLFANLDSVKASESDDMPTVIYSRYQR